MRLVTFNALFKGDVRPRLRALAEALDHGGFDVACLQEVMLRHNLRLLRGYPYRVASGVLLKDGLVLLSRWPVRRHRFVRYPVSRPVRGEWLMRKGIQLAEVVTPAGPVAVVNTHLSANRDDDWSPGNRYTRIGARELDRLAAALPATLPLVVAGDFNLPRNSTVYTRFVARTGLTDLMAGDSGPTYRPTPAFPSPPALDQLLVRGLTGRAELVLRDAVTLPGGRRAYLSDHYGIAADLTLPAVP